MGHMSELAFEQEKYGFEIDFTRAYGEVISKLEELKPGEAVKALQFALSMAELDKWYNDLVKAEKENRD